MVSQADLEVDIREKVQNVSALVSICPLTHSFKLNILYGASLFEFCFRSDS